MVAFMIARFALVATAAILLIAGMAGSLRAEWWGIAEICGAILVLWGVARPASGVRAPVRRTSR